MTFKEIGKELPPVWEYKDEGDFIEGTYAKKKTEVGKNNANMYYIEKDGKVKAVWGSKVLDDKMDDLNLEIGDTIRITYEGENEKPKYHKFKVEKDFPDEEGSDANPVEDGAEEAEEEAE